MRHRFHAICPYFAMFPEAFVEKHLVYSKMEDVVLDPFSGRGTTGFQSLLSGRNAISSDINPVAACVSRAKMRSPSEKRARARLKQLESEFEEIDDPVFDDEFYQACFEENTLRQIVFLKHRLRWQKDDRDAFLSALILGCLHGESHKSGRYFSNRMPRTIATKPDYSIRWWKKNNSVAPERNVFRILSSELTFRFDTGRPRQMGDVAQVDARNAATAFKKYKRKVGLVITSPPYLDTTHFGEDQWLRNWFLGGQERPTKMARGDDRHSSRENYWQFLTDAWGGISDLLRTDPVVVVVRIGGSKVNFEEAKSEIIHTLSAGTKRRVLLHSAIESEIVGGQLRSFRPSAEGTKREFDIIAKVL
jgi:hypothetical protein